MNRNAIAIVPVLAVATLALTAVSFGLAPQAFAGGHNHYHHHHHNDHNHHNDRNNQVHVSQQINQLNNCTQALCANEAQNQAFIHR